MNQTTLAPVRNFGRYPGILDLPVLVRQDDVPRVRRLRARANPRYTIDECRKLRMTFGYPFKVRLRLVKPEPSRKRSTWARSRS